MILMDKMKDHSCGIKPVFGYGDGLDLPNLGFMFEPVLNVEPAPVIPPFYIAQPFNQPALYLGPGLALIPGIDPPPQQATTLNAAHTAVPGFTVTGQVNQTTNIIDQHSHLSVAEIVANAVQQHIASHHPPQNVTGTANNGFHDPDGGINVAQIITNAIQQELDDYSPPGVSILNTSVSHQGLTNVHASTFTTTHGFHVPGAPNYPSHVSATGHSSNNVAAAQPSQQSASEMSTNEQFLLPIDEEAAPESFSDFDDTPMNFYSGVIYNLSSGPLDDESNFSNPALQAPFSSPAHHYNFNPTYDDDDDDSAPIVNVYQVSPPVYQPATPSYQPASPSYQPTSPSYNIDDAENSDNENQINNSDVPNQSS